MHQFGETIDDIQELVVRQTNLATWMEQSWTVLSTEVPNLGNHQWD